jgi:hypothetical protein
MFISIITLLYRYFLLLYLLFCSNFSFGTNSDVLALLNTYTAFHRRLELLSRSGRFADAAAVLKETSMTSPEEAVIIRDVIKDLRQNAPEKIEEFAKSILPWLETVVYCKLVLLFFTIYFIIYLYILYYIFYHLM